MIYGAKSSLTLSIFSGEDHDETLAGEKDMEPSITEPPANRRQLAKASPHLRIVRSAALIADRCTIGSER
jgi:hypothetical protein